MRGQIGHDPADTAAAVAGPGPAAALLPTGPPVPISPRAFWSDLNVAAGPCIGPYHNHTANWPQTDVRPRLWPALATLCAVPIADEADAALKDPPPDPESARGADWYRGDNPLLNMTRDELRATAERLARARFFTIPYEVTDEGRKRLLVLCPPDSSHAQWTLSVLFAVTSE
jgi:hypothetical protein